MNTTGNISDIKHYAINDGPGIRVTVFLKGCPLTCAWCHNPESISPEREVMYIANRCIQCGECIKVCPHDALHFEKRKIVCDRSKCTLCEECTDACPTLALEIVGEEMSPKELIEVIEKDHASFEQSGGGVTFSGGEPLMQPEFLLELLKLCRERRVHTVLDTSGYGDTEELMRIAEFTDLFLFDLKLANPDDHLQWTGVETDLIHANLRKLCERGANIIFRMPMIHRVNCDKKDIKKTAELIISLPGNNHHIDLLLWHNIAVKKYEQLNKAYAHADSFEEPTPKELSAAVMIFAKHGIEASAH